MKLFRSFLQLLRAISPFHFLAGTVTPNWDHLSQDRQIFRSPLVQAPALSDILARSRDFLNALPDMGEDMLMIVALCGRELRVNIHLVEHDSSLVPVFNEYWMNQGLFNYYIQANGAFELLRRPMPGRFYHDEDVRVSFTHRLTVPEYDALVPMVMRYVPQRKIHAEPFTDTDLRSLRARGTPLTVVH